ncbi:Glu/Leu/Phe/Val family dehydrogenase [Litoribrevibacter albus]|uniref:Leucine dehydrogenase n=1 Tax=Litoribrevibacter albus TaxID=1473156 RepID=A0AA37W6J8_9GAMM|nr:Glu/Leu/Phe/Val dehydrogenase dimerization domain-containing protein [Litoribrevibacter albus]GLQ32142.1 leucine dehydrogenase [Litoribrevibacter albus]
MFELMREHQLPELHFFQQDRLNAIVAIHSTELGPALGGCRFVPYSDTASAALDAARLAQGMSYKAALAGVPFGGGKSVILYPEGEFDREALFEAFGSVVEQLNGRYITAMDSGTHVEDMDIIRRTTSHVASHSEIGDPSPHTARGVFHGIKMILEEELNIPLDKATVAIQGLGNVGYALMEKLIEHDVTMIVSDINQERTRRAMKEYGVFVAPVSELLTEPCDVLAPCGLGGVITPELVPRLNCKAIAGSANNQLLNLESGELLHRREILYAPDFVINSGGLIYASGSYNQLPKNQIENNLENLTSTLTKVFSESHKQNKPSDQVAVTMAKEIIANHSK